jgi:hypothetical protein
MLLFDGLASTATSRARRGDKANPRFVAHTSASVRSSLRSRPTSTRNRARQCTCEREQYRTFRERNDRASFPHNMAARIHNECFRRQQRFDLIEQESALFTARKQARRCLFRTSHASSTSAVSAGIRALCAASSARVSAERAAFVRIRRIAIPATTSS